MNEKARAIEVDAHTADMLEDGLGLIKMRERVHQLNGTFEFDSKPGLGTTVRAIVPFRPVS
jgi:signal transduction histidine kinase